MESITKEDTLRDRQKTLFTDNFFDKTVAVIVGLGGIGSWVALDCALLGYKFLYLIDPDKIELSNLNRTLFKLDQIGQYKVDAIAELIKERRTDVSVLKIPDLLTKDTIGDLPLKSDIFDCTDNLRQRALFKDKKFRNYIKLGYDGFSMTIIKNDFSSGAWGEDSTYQFVPSFFGSPQIISAIGVISAITETEKNNYTITKDCRTLILDNELDNSQNSI